MLKAQVAAREAEMKTKTEESAAVEQRVTQMSAAIAVMAKQIVDDQAAVAAAMKKLDADKAAAAPLMEAQAASNAALAAARGEHQQATTQVERWQNYLQLTGELDSLKQARAARDDAELASLEAAAILEEKKQELAQAVKAMDAAKVQHAEMGQKVTSVQQSMKAIEARMTAQKAAVVQSEKAVPVLKASLDQARAALAILPNEKALQDSVNALAAVLDGQQKQIPVLGEEVKALATQITMMQAEMVAMQKSMTELAASMQESMKLSEEIRAGMATLEGQAKEMESRFTAAIAAVDAATATVEARRELLRPLLQLSSVR